MKFNSGKNLFALSLLLLFAAFVFSPAISNRQEARACWNNVLIECFSNTANSFPWCNPVGSGRCWGQSPARPNVRSWGVQDRIYSSTFSDLCGNDIQSIWCIGGSRSYDPDVNPYLTNMDSYIRYGPFSLANADFAHLRFQLLCESEYLGDSIFWGVADNANIPNANIVLLDSSFSGSTLQFYGQQWHWVDVDLADLHHPDGTPGSAIGMSTVYAFWWFHSNSNAVAIPPQPLDNGAFIDNVLIEWDDGLYDYGASEIALYFADEDTSLVTDNLVVNDEVRAGFRWNTCSGSIVEYPDVQITVTVTDPLGFEDVVFDSVMTGIIQDSIYFTYTDTWIVETEGNNIFTVRIDPMNEVIEAHENNNTSALTIYAWPPNPHPEFIWLAPGETSSLVGDSLVMLRWEAYDVGESAYIYLYYDDNTEGCNGASIPGGLNLREHDGEDSLMWNIWSWIPGTVRYPYVYLSDAAWDTCIYAPMPVERTNSAQALPVGVPGELFLAQNYPNPFNPETEISYGITRAGLVTLRVYDLLGRQVAELVNENLTPGTYVSHFNGRDLSSGVYLYALTTEEGVLNNKMVLLK